MNALSSLPRLLLLAAAVIGLQGVALAQDATVIKLATKPKSLVTTIYLVRHAEKDSTSNPTDPTLSAMGQVRAEALSQLLGRRNIKALFTTDTKRTRATLTPLAAATKLEPQVYNGAEPTALAVRLRRDFAGQSVLVVGHSNTLLPVIESLGGTPPLEKIGDDEYEYLFTVRIVPGALPTVGMEGYGPEPRPKAVARPASAAKPARGR